MHEDPVDLSPLHPARDPERWEAMVASITARALPALAENAAGRSPLVLLVGWMRPTLAAAATVAAVSIGVMTAAGDGASATTVTRTVAEELNLPEPVTDWIVEERTPSTVDLIHALEGEML